MILGTTLDIYANETVYALQVHIDDESVVGTALYVALYENNTEANAIKNITPKLIENNPISSVPAIKSFVARTTFTTGIHAVVRLSSISSVFLSTRVTVLVVSNASALNHWL